MHKDARCRHPKRPHLVQHVEVGGAGAALLVFVVGAAPGKANIQKLAFVDCHYHNCSLAKLLQLPQVDSLEQNLPEQWAAVRTTWA